VKRLRRFWQEITAPTRLWPFALSGSLTAWQQKASALTALTVGQPGFFTPRDGQKPDGRNVYPKTRAMPQLCAMLLSVIRPKQ
jgi:hypothetical protein